MQRMRKELQRTDDHARAKKKILSSALDTATEDLKPDEVIATFAGKK